MPASFLHGIETIETSTGPVPITVVKSSVIGLVGSAPLWAAIGAPAMWQPGWVVAAGLQVVDPNGNIQQCSTAGTTGTAAPTWATTLNATTADGTAVWKLVTIAGTLLQTPTLVNFTRQSEYRWIGRRLWASDPGIHDSLRARGHPGPRRRPGDRGQRLQSLPPLHRDHGPGDGAAGVGPAGAQPGAYGRLECGSQKQRRLDYLYKRD